MFRSKMYVMSIMRKMTSAWRTRHSKGTVGPERCEHLQIPSGLRGAGAEHLLLNKNKQPNFLTSYLFCILLPPHIHCFVILLSTWIWHWEQFKHESLWQDSAQATESRSPRKPFDGSEDDTGKNTTLFGKGYPVTPWATYCNQINWLTVIIVTLN